MRETARASTPGAAPASAGRHWSAGGARSQRAARRASFRHRAAGCGAGCSVHREVEQHEASIGARARADRVRAWAVCPPGLPRRARAPDRSALFFVPLASASGGWVGQRIDLLHNKRVYQQRPSTRPLSVVIAPLVERSRKGIQAWRRIFRITWAATCLSNGNDVAVVWTILVDDKVGKPADGELTHGGPAFPWRTNLGMSFVQVESPGDRIEQPGAHPGRRSSYPRTASANSRDAGSLTCRRFTGRAHRAQCGA